MVRLELIDDLVQQVAEKGGGILGVALTDEEVAEFHRRVDALDPPAPMLEWTDELMLMVCCSGSAVAH